MYTLVDVYFENAYNATLLLHKGRYLDSLAAGTVEAHLVLSVCAYAAKYLSRLLCEMSRLTNRPPLVSTVTIMTKPLSATTAS